MGPIQGLRIFGLVSLERLYTITVEHRKPYLTHEGPLNAAFGSGALHPSTPREYLDPKETTFFGLLIRISL